MARLGEFLIREGLISEAALQAASAALKEQDFLGTVLVRQGALTLKEAAAREGVPGAQPRAEVADALLDSTVLTVTDSDRTADVTLRALSALTRMGFLPRGGRARIDIAGRWIRVVGEYGTVYLERPGSGLSGLTIR